MITLDDAEGMLTPVAHQWNFHLWLRRNSPELLGPATVDPAVFRLNEIRGISSYRALLENRVYTPSWARR